MARQTICFRSNAGNDFPTEFEALRDDLRHFVFGVCKNEATARDVTDAMIAALDRVYKPVPPGHAPTMEVEFDGIERLIRRLAETRPENPQPSLPLDVGPDPVTYDDSDKRPKNCRNRLRDEGKPYPRSGCLSCSNGGLRGCPYETRDDDAGTVVGCICDPTPLSRRNPDCPVHRPHGEGEHTEITGR